MDLNNTETFGERLRALRKEKRISQPELAKQVKVGKSVISLWERNECEPKLSNLISISLYFGVSIDFLAGLKEF